MGEGGFKCTVCPDTQYCMDCRKLDADARAESMVDGNLEDNTVSVSPSAINLEMEFLGEPKFEILFGNGSGLKKRDHKVKSKTGLVMEGAESVTSSKSKNWNKYVACDLCGK